MLLSAREIVEILRTLDELGYQRFRYEQNDVRLEVDTSTAGEPATASPTSQAPVNTVSEPASTPKEQETPTTAPRTTFSPPKKGLISVDSPMTGTFYRAPSPDASPFVEVGSKVEDHDTVCLVDVMKLFNSISAGTKGTIADICAENGAQVEAGQPLMWIEPDA
ncbi:MAG: acetyl-CoA carboxylase, biotin carboxyl carrier protein [Alphaproteobacteria bacterium]|nr:acetyl-CoA carboxylase, biotin carboxyl carrier protein [Alphaproteobacteria bacterium]|tara:strand:- start:252 stop:743 length:492 start_codon:yes stop_codon:yes gene_type:complete